MASHEAVGCSTNEAWSIIMTTSAQCFGTAKQDRMMEFYATAQLNRICLKLLLVYPGVAGVLRSCYCRWWRSSKDECNSCVIWWPFLSQNFLIHVVAQISRKQHVHSFVSDRANRWTSPAPHRDVYTVRINWKSHFNFT